MNEGITGGQEKKKKKSVAQGLREEIVGWVDFLVVPPIYGIDR